MSTDKHWSKLQRAIYDLISSDIHFQIHCVVYPMRSLRGIPKPVWAVGFALEQTLRDATLAVFSFLILKRLQHNTKLPRYWITLGKEIIWDYPKDFIKKYDNTKYLTNNFGEIFPLPYSNEVSAISQVIREYIDTPKIELFDKFFKNDKWGITEILKATDRRIGTRRLNDLKNETDNIAVQKIIDQRMK
jgi:hypothetical protein